MHSRKDKNIERVKRRIIVESKNNKFVRLAENRTNNAIKQIQLIGNLSNRRNYEYTEEDVEEIFKALNRAIKAAKDQYIAELEREFNSFKLK